MSIPLVSIVDGQGQCQPLPKAPALSTSSQPYRLYRFLTDLEDLLVAVTDDQERLTQMVPLVERLLEDSDWLYVVCPPPDPDLGWSLVTLYEEPDFPLTVQLVAWNPQIVSPIHNHGCWGLVALLQGQEEHHFWQRSPQLDYPDQIAWVQNHTLNSGDILTFLPDAIHSLEALGTEATISFNLYGETDYSQRFEFDAIAHTATLF